jgi:hypothetical protein
VAVSKPQVVEDEEHERVFEKVAAIDVAKASGEVCVRAPHPSRAGARRSTVWTVDATMNAVLGLAAQLVAEEIQLVTLESTSDYWRIWFYVLEAAGLTVQLVNASQAKNLPGWPKTDPLTELPGGVPQVSGRRGALVATVADHDHRRRYATGPVAAGDAAGRVA